MLTRLAAAGEQARNLQAAIGEICDVLVPEFADVTGAKDGELGIAHRAQTQSARHVVTVSAPAILRGSLYIPQWERELYRR